MLFSWFVVQDGEELDEDEKKRLEEERVSAYFFLYWKEALMQVYPYSFPLISSKCK